ncbi:TniQ family protein [Phormidium tenue FACHB-886]|nr:TniQ family protein [Phormidium tenue FACHB-886]
MIADPTTIYGFWDLNEPILPARSRLYCLEPIGLGTAYVESLTGYVARLSETHRVETGMLILTQIAPFMKEGYVFDGRAGGIDKLFGRYTQAFNGASDWTNALVTALESLTLRHDLRFLSMLPWAEVIPLRYLLRTNRAWCPVCYEDWNSNEQEIYEPLVWVFDAIEICPHHDLPLCTKCPHCDVENRQLDWSSRPGHCSKCKEWLGMRLNFYQANLEEVSKEDLSRQLWVFENIGGLLAATPRLACSPSKETISTAIATYVEATSQGKVSRFANKVGIAKQQIHRHIDGKTLPSLKTLLHLCKHLDLPLLNFLTQQPTLEDLTRASENLPQLERSARKETLEIRHNAAGVKVALEAALLEEPPPSVQNLSTRLGYASPGPLYYHASELTHALAKKYAAYDKMRRLEGMRSVLESTLQKEEYPPPSMQDVARREGFSVQLVKRTFPELSKAISARYEMYRKSLKEVRIGKLRQEVRDVALQLHNQRIEPTGARISKYLSKPRSILQQAAIEAVHEIRRELGWEK